MSKKGFCKGFRALGDEAVLRFGVGWTTFGCGFKLGLLKTLCEGQRAPKGLLDLRD